MLETLKIKNLAIIDETEIEFKNGLNIISGETGAGKSIVIDAISLILGSRADSNLIRSGSDEAIVEGLFDIHKNNSMQNRLKNLGFSSGSDQLLIKRTVSANGKHRIYVNGEFATLSSLQNLTEGLVELCGQHEHQSLTKPTRQIEMLDRFGDLNNEVEKFESTFSEAKAIKLKKESLEQNEAQRSKHVDFLRFQLDELKNAELKENEDVALHDEKKLLQSSKNRIEAAEAIREYLESDESGALNSVRSALNKLKSLIQLDESVLSLKDYLENGLVAIEDASVAISRYLDTIQSNPNRLEEIQDRLALIANLKHKYGNSVQEMLETQTQLEEEFNSLNNSDESIKKLAEAYAKLKKELLSLGKKLSEKRSKAADKLSKEVTKELKDLKMENAKFFIDVQDIAEFDEWTSAGPNKIDFSIQTNSGESAKPLGKIASGGELSRLMLAMRRVISDRGGIGVYLFDEIDAGIGGQTAFQVGKKLKSVAKYHQVICITHLPQVAAFADLHLVVQKQISGKRTITEVRNLKSEKEKKEELARMLGGPKLSQKSLENAAELLDLAN